MVTTEQKILAILCHLGYLIGAVSLIIVPLIIFFWKKDDPFVRDHAKQALVAQTVLAVLGLVVSVLCIILIGLLLVPVLAVVYILFLICAFIGAYRAFNGEYYRYPFIQDLVEKF